MLLGKLEENSAISHRKTLKGGKKKKHFTSQAEHSNTKWNQFDDLQLDAFRQMVCTEFMLKSLKFDVNPLNSAD